MAKKHFEEPHLKAIRKTAQTENQVIIFREVGGAALKLKKNGVDILDENGEIKHCNVAAKDMRVKAKSAGKGDFAGFIPIDAKNSKIGERLQELLKFRDSLKNNESINIKKSDDLLKKINREIASVSANIEKTNIKTQKAIKSGQLKEVTAIVGNKTMQVLADEGGNPFTADSDILTHTTHNDFKSENGDEIYLNEVYGYTTVETSTLIGKLNINIHEEDVRAGKVGVNDKNLTANKQKKGRNTTEIAHGADSANPNADILSITADRPLTAFTPSGDIVEITSKTEFIEFADKMSKRGYKIPANKGWGIEFNEGTVNYVDTDNADKNNDIGLSHKNSAKSFWKRELHNIESQISRMGKMQDGTKNKTNNVLSLELAKFAIIAEIDGETEFADDMWQRVNKLNKKYQKNNNQENGPVAKLLASKDILKYHQACLTQDPQKIEDAAYNITHGSEATLQMYKLSVPSSMFVKTVEQSRNKHQKVIEAQKSTDKKQEKGNNGPNNKKSAEYRKFINRVIAEKREAVH